MKIYNGQNMILGRLATVIAKDILLGEEVALLNCEKIVVSGRKVNSFTRARQQLLRKGHPLKSALVSRSPDRFVRRVVRGMIPWKRARGKEAFHRLRCYIGVPAEFTGKEMIMVQDASAKKLPTLQFATISEICRQVGQKIR
ncbi:50S ribosomal protein L13 [Candidatus Woesearchaeota archaeon]|nr:50S ribosomal protein L13 [Candidatus Woesearchaeota archaeon]